MNSILKLCREGGGVGGWGGELTAKYVLLAMHYAMLRKVCCDQNPPSCMFTEHFANPIKRFYSYVSLVYGEVNEYFTPSILLAD